MELYKGIFWYNPTKEILIVKKVQCDENGIALADVTYSAKSGDNFSHEIEWTRLPPGITEGHPYNYYPYGSVEIKSNKATVCFSPVLDTPQVIHLIDQEFGLSNAATNDLVTVQTVVDNSAQYDYCMHYPANICTMCGKVFDFWDNQENFCFDHHIGYGSKYDLNHAQIKLCCDCFDKVMAWLIPQCKYEPLTNDEEKWIIR